MSNKTPKNLISRRNLLRTGAAATAGAVASQLLGQPQAAFAQGTFGKARKVILIPQAGGTWYVPAQVGMIDFAKMVGWDTQVITSNDYSVENHLASIDNAIAAKADVIITELESVGMVSGFKKALAAGITMVIWDQGIADEANKLGLSIINQNEFNAGVLQGHTAAMFAQQLSGKKDGQFVIGNGNPGSVSIDLRQHGTEQGIAEYNKANGTNYVTEAFPDSGFSDTAAAIQKYAAKMQQYGDKLVGLIGLGGNSAIAIAKMLKEHNVAPGKFAVGSQDSFPEQWAYIDSGYIQWGIDQNFYLMGFMPTASAWAFLERGLPIRNIDTGQLLVTKPDLPAAKERAAAWQARAKELGLSY